jgi:hypothetical protein
MEWEEVLLIAWGGALTATPSGLLSAPSNASPADRRRVKTGVMKARLLDDAAHYEELAAKADRIEGATDF